MFNVENLRQFGVTNLPKSFFLLLAFLALFLPSAALAAHPCENASKHLHGDMDVVGNRGGLWSLMEQKGLKDNSIIGMQADGKLARLVVRFETLCQSKNKPGKQLFEEIQNLLGNARLIFNPRISGEEITKAITKLVKDADTMLAKIE